MQRKINPKRVPLLSGAKVRLIDRIGSGKSNFVHSAVIEDRFGRRRFVAIKQPRNDGVFPLPTAESRINSQRAWLDFFNAGLPVARFSKIDLRKSSPTFLHVFQPNLQRKRKLIPVHDMGAPVFLEELRIGKDSKLLNLMAKDVAKIHNLGYSSHNIDFWDLYKKGDTFDRVIVDTEGFYRPKKDYLGRVLPPLESNVDRSFRNLKHHLGEKEFEYFFKQYCKYSKHLPKFL